MYVFMYLGQMVITQDWFKRPAEGLEMEQARDAAIVQSCIHSIDRAHAPNANPKLDN